MEGLEVAAAKEAASSGRAASWSDGRCETQWDGCPLPASILIIIYFKQIFLKFYPLTPVGNNAQLYVGLLSEFSLQGAIGRDKSTGPALWQADALAT